ncbi:MAG: beta propeller repeat protein [Candidatus Dormibacteria bacterium]
MDSALPAGHSMLLNTVALDFATSQDGWLAVGFGEGWDATQGGRAGTGVGLVLYRTIDGGAVWSLEMRFTPYTTLASGLRSGCASPSMVFTTPDQGWTTGACVEQTRDGGGSWQPVELPRPRGISPTRWVHRSCSSTAPSFASAAVGWLALTCTLPGPTGGIANLQLLYQTSNGGAEWAVRQPPIRWPQLPPTYGTMDGPALGALGWLLGATPKQLQTYRPGIVSEELFRTVDGGLHWELVDRALWASAVDFVSAETGFAVRACLGAVLACINPLLLETFDGGRSWVVLHPHLVDGTLRPPLPYV